MARYNSSGWHFQSVRHSNARRTGRAGGTYKCSVQDNLLKKEFLQLKKNHPELQRTKLIITPKQKIRGYYDENNDTIALPPNTTSDLLAHEIAHDIDYKDTPPTKHDKQFWDYDEEINKEINNNKHYGISEYEYMKNRIADINVNEQNYKERVMEELQTANITRKQYDELLKEAEETPTTKSTKHYGKPNLQYIPSPPLEEANNLPVQVSIIVPSTKNIIDKKSGKEKSKKISEKEFDERVKETKKEFDNLFGADTAISDVGSYFNGKKHIDEKGVIVESSTSIPKYKENIKKVVELAEEKQKKYLQDTMAVKVEGRLFIVPKKSYIDDDKITKNKPIIVS